MVKNALSCFKIYHWRNCIISLASFSPNQMNIEETICADIFSTCKKPNVYIMWMLAIVFTYICILFSVCGKFIYLSTPVNSLKTRQYYLLSVRGSTVITTIHWLAMGFTARYIGVAFNGMGITGTMEWKLVAGLEGNSFVTLWCFNKWSPFSIV